MLNNLQKCDNHRVQKFILTEYFVKKKEICIYKEVYDNTGILSKYQVKRKLLITPRSCTNIAYITTTPSRFKKKTLEKYQVLWKRRIGQCIY